MGVPAPCLAGCSATSAWIARSRGPAARACGGRRPPGSAGHRASETAALYLQPGYQEAGYLVVVESILSSSGVVRTNILALIEQISPKRIFVVSPVMYSGAENALRDEFPPAIADLFEFVAFAVDDYRTQTGEARPGIGGPVYHLLGLEDQPARTGFMPQLVKTLLAL